MRTAKNLRYGVGAAVLVIAATGATAAVVPTVQAATRSLAITSPTAGTVVASGGALAVAGRAPAGARVEVRGKHEVDGSTVYTVLSTVTADRAGRVSTTVELTRSVRLYLRTGTEGDHSYSVSTPVTVAASSSPAPTPSPPAPTPSPPAPSPAPGSPAQVLDLRTWKLGLPVDTSRPGDPDEISSAQLTAGYRSDYFRVVDGGVQFTAPVEGDTTKNSNYPRSELREMSDGSTHTPWSTSKGRHRMVITQAITATPKVKPHVVAGQIHDSEDDVVMVRLEGERLFVEGDGKELALLDPAYLLGTFFTVQIDASGGHIRVSYDGVQKLDHARSVSGNYFKAGAYTQSNLGRGDKTGARGQVVIRSLAVTHTDR